MTKQIELNLYKGSHGGRRPGAGRRRLRSSGVAHRCRERISPRTPVHINFKYRVAVKNKVCLRILKRAILNARSHEFRVIHFSLQHNHVHIIAEAESNEVLTRGMRSLMITMAKGLKQGRVQLERYHLHVLRSVRETRNALHYVLFNSQRHGSRIIDEYSSLLSHPRALALIRAYVTQAKITVTVRKGDTFNLDKARTWFIARAGSG